MRPGLSGWMNETAEVLELLAFWKPEQQAAHRFPIWRPKNVFFKGGIKIQKKGKDMHKIIDMEIRRKTAMQEYMEIVEVFGREILDSRGNPTLEVEVTLADGSRGRAAVPSGASTGKFEAVELRDREERYQGKGVQKAVSYVNKELRQAVLHKNAVDQHQIDRLLIEADGSENKGNFGANAILGISMAVAQAAANSLELPLYRYLGGTGAKQFPVPMSNVCNGGAHTTSDLDWQEFMIMPVGACCYREGLRMITEIYHHLRTILKEDGHVTAVGDEGGFAPNVKDAFTVFEYLTKATQKAGYQTGKDIVFAMDAAASELYDEKSKTYIFPGESRMSGKTVVRSAREMIDYYRKLTEQFPLVSIEDGLHEEDWDGWVEMTRELGERVQLVGDDLFVTNTKRLEKGISLGAGNAVLVKVNQIGTVSEAMDTIELAQRSGYRTIISHRSGETEDTFIADLAVAVNAGQIKTGAPCRSDRVAKYNQLLRIEERLGTGAFYRNPF